MWCCWDILSQSLFNFCPSTACQYWSGGGKHSDHKVAQLLNSFSHPPSQLPLPPRQSSRSINIAFVILISSVTIALLHFLHNDASCPWYCGHVTKLIFSDISIWTSIFYTTCIYYDFLRNLMIHLGAPHSDLGSKLHGLSRWTTEPIRQYSGFMVFDL